VEDVDGSFLIDFFLWNRRDSADLGGIVECGGEQVMMADVNSTEGDGGQRQVNEREEQNQQDMYIFSCKVREQVCLQ